MTEDTNTNDGDGGRRSPVSIDIEVNIDVHPRELLSGWVGRPGGGDDE